VKNSREKLSQLSEQKNHKSEFEQGVAHSIDSKNTDYRAQPPSPPPQKMNTTHQNGTCTSIKNMRVLQISEAGFGRRNTGLIGIWLKGGRSTAFSFPWEAARHRKVPEHTSGKTRSISAYNRKACAC